MCLTRMELYKNRVIVLHFYRIKNFTRFVAKLDPEHYFNST